MADLRCSFAGIASPNPFWLASAPPTDKAYNVVRAFKAGWGGVVWKTLGEDPPIVNVTSRYGAVHLDGHRMMGFNNIELITDRPLDINLREIKQVKRDWPDRAIVVSLMVPCDEDSWQHILAAVEGTGADGVELIAKIDQALCIKCGLCHIACEDTSHQAIAARRVDGVRRYEVVDAECIGCNLCQHVCPVADCITMIEVDTGLPPLDWSHDPRNPHRVAAE
jgi:NAD-dependent dihydropyrimidine dehydrogenase PreA subunit